MKIGIEANLYRYLFKNVYFINGTAYAGKSTMVRMLAERFGGIECGENYHLALRDAAVPEYQPNMSYFQTMSGWQEFISRTPDEYAAWIEGVSRECAELEIVKLLQLCTTGKKIFVDTNIGVDILREISDYHHVAIMLSPQSMSVNRFFDRPDADKQFLYQKLMECPNPQAALENYRKCLERINSPARYRTFAESGFYTHVRTENSTIEDTFRKLEEHFGLN